MFASMSTSSITLLTLAALSGLTTLVQAAPQFDHLKPLCLNPCPSGSKCVWGQCCLNTEACGNSCCRNNPGLSLFRSYCANASRSLCCLTGEFDADGICCPSGQRNCGGKCCMGTCGANGTCNAAATDCQRRWGSSSKPCQNNSQCTALGGWACHPTGCCYELPK